MGNVLIYFHASLQAWPLTPRRQEVGSRVHHCIYKISRAGSGVLLPGVQGIVATYEICVQLKSCNNLFFHNLFSNHPMILKFCTEHGSLTAVLCANFENHWTIGNGYKLKNQDLILRQISRIVMTFWILPWPPTLRHPTNTRPQGIRGHRATLTR